MGEANRQKLKKMSQVDGSSFDAHALLSKLRGGQKAVASNSASSVSLADHQSVSNYSVQSNNYEQPARLSQDPSAGVPMTSTPQMPGSTMLSYGGPMSPPPPPPPPAQAAGNTQAKIALRQAETIQQRRENMEIRAELEKEIKKLKEDVSKLRKENKQLQAEKVDLEQQLLHQKQKSDDIIAQLRAKLVGADLKKTVVTATSAIEKSGPRIGPPKHHSQVGGAHNSHNNNIASNNMNNMNQIGGPTTGSFGVNLNSPMNLLPQQQQQQALQQLQGSPTSLLDSSPTTNGGNFAGPTISELMRRNTPSHNDFVDTLRRTSSATVPPMGSMPEQQQQQQRRNSVMSVLETDFRRSSQHQQPSSLQPQQQQQQHQQQQQGFNQGYDGEYFTTPHHRLHDTHAVHSINNIHGHQFPTGNAVPMGPPRSDQFYTQQHYRHQQQQHQQQYFQVHQQPQFGPGYQLNTLMSSPTEQQQHHHPGYRSDQPLHGVNPHIHSSTTSAHVVGEEEEDDNDDLPVVEIDLRT